MKKLTVIVKPANREDVIDIMESCAVYGVMETDITGYGNQKGYRVMYRGTMSGPNVLMKCKFETVGDDKTIEVLKGFLPDAKKFDEISIQEVIEKDLKVVDMTASILCKENKMPMLVFGLNEENSIVNAANGKINGTRVTV